MDEKVVTTYESPDEEIKQMKEDIRYLATNFILLCKEEQWEVGEDILEIAKRYNIEL